MADLAKQTVEAFTRLGRTIGTAESLTGGMMAAQIASVSGASAVLMGGIVAYDPRVKHEVLHVEQKVLDIINQEMPVTYVDENHINVGGRIHKCSGPRIHVPNTGNIENFKLLPHLIHDPFKRRYLLVGCVGENSEELLQSLDIMRQHPAWD